MLSLLILGIVAFAAIPQQDDDDKGKKNAPKVQPKAQPKALTVEDESIPDSLVHSLEDTEDGSCTYGRPGFQCP